MCANSTLNFFIYYANGKRFRMAWMESVGCVSCATKDSSTAAAAGVDPYLLSKNTIKSKSSKRTSGLKFVSKRKDVKDEFRAVVTV